MMLRRGAGKEGVQAAYGHMRHGIHKQSVKDENEKGELYWIVMCSR
jgi:hypothetical protein